MRRRCTMRQLRVTCDGVLVVERRPIRTATTVVGVRFERTCASNAERMSAALEPRHGPLTVVHV